MHDDLGHLVKPLLETLAEGVVVADARGQHVLCNPTAEQLLGTVAGLRPLADWPHHYGLYGVDRKTLLRPDQLPIARALHGQESPERDVFIRNTVVPRGVSVRMAGRPVRDAGGKIVGAIAVLRRLSGSKGADVEIRRRLEDLHLAHEGLRVAYDRLAKLATTDDLTGVWNHRALRERLEQLVTDGHTGHGFAVGLLDIDRFKHVNDTYGHLVGNKLLASLARTVRANLRGTDFLARYGGDEFCFLMPGATEERAAQLAERLRQAVARAYRNAPELTASLGVCALTTEQGSAESLLNAADEALYRAKDDGRNRVVRFSSIGKRAVA